MAQCIHHLAMILPLGFHSTPLFAHDHDVMCCFIVPADWQGLLVFHRAAWRSMGALNETGSGQRCWLCAWLGAGPCLGMAASYSNSRTAASQAGTGGSKSACDSR